MDIMESVYERAKARPMRVAFPEAEEEKIIQAARQCADEGVCVPVLVGHADAIRAAVEKIVGRSPFRGHAEDTVFCGRWDTRR